MPDSRLAKPVLLTCSWMMLPLLTACYEFKELNIKENDAQIPTFKIAWKPRQDMELYLDAGKTEGNGSMELAQNDRLSVLGLELSGPKNLQNDFELESEFAALKLNLTQSDKLFWNLILGVRKVSMHLGLNDGTTQFDKQASHVDLAGGVELGMPISHQFRISAQISGNRFSGDMEFLEQKLMLEYQPNRTVAMFGGWQKWIYTHQESLTNIELQAAGLGYGLHVYF